ncbi:MAG: phage portal protein [Planctomycetota bacterium]|jgi:lambda family phage portal protein
MVALLDRVKSWFKPDTSAQSNEWTWPTTRAASGYGDAVQVDYKGDKYWGGFGTTRLLSLDYWTLRQRSSQLFHENLYARGLIRRFVTNIINTGLTLEAVPEESVIGLSDNEAEVWSETVENRFGLWAKSPTLCDFEQRRTFGQIQAEALTEALISGDVLVILRMSPQTKLPQVQLVSGNKVQTPYRKKTIRAGNEIKNGVEINRSGRQVAYWIVDNEGNEKRIPAVGEKSGRRVAWLYYGIEKRLDDVRGEPLLSLVLQSLKEIDRYRDAALRKATLNSMLAMFIEKTEDKMGTRPMTGGAIRREAYSVTNSAGETRTFNTAEQIPGMVIDELQTGERPVPHSTAGTDVNFGPFEDAIVQAIAWACETPPEILRLAFSNNYSASQAAINEYKMFLNRERTRTGDTFCVPVYKEWFLSEVLMRKIEARGFLEAWRNPAMYDVAAAWLVSDWSGAIKPSTDMLKQANAFKVMVAEGWTNNSRSARELTGTKFSKNMKRIRRENELKVEAARPLVEFQNEVGTNAANEALAQVELKAVE